MFRKPSAHVARAWSEPTLLKLAYGYEQPKLAAAIAALPESVLVYGGDDSVAMAYDIGADTAVWFVATLPQQQGKGLAKAILKRLLLDARERGQRTASPSTSAKTGVRLCLPALIASTRPGAVWTVKPMMVS